MRAALGSLTVRGRAFLASGFTAVVCGLFLLERDLVRIGLLVAALPLVASFYVAARPHHLRVRREVTPGHVAPGDTATVRVSIQNASAPTAVLLAEEQVSAQLAGHPRFVVPPMGRDQREVLEYTVRPETRGRHVLGPLQVRQREPFGMVERLQETDGKASLLVLPRVTPLSEIRLTGSWFSSGEDHPRSFSVGRVADVVVREYRRGDDLRRVHWRSTARMGELMVRNEEQLWQARAVVVLDNRASSHRGSGPGSSFEAAVSAAASVTVHLAGLGYQVQLVTGSGTSEAWHERGRPLDPFPILERLATLDQVSDQVLPRVSLGEEIAGGVVVGLLGAGTPDDHRWWGRFPRHNAEGLALVLDVDSWGQRPAGQPAPPGAPGWLTDQGWRTAGFGMGDSLASTWQELDR